MGNTVRGRAFVILDIIVIVFYSFNIIYVKDNFLISTFTKNILSFIHIYPKTCVRVSECKLKLNFSDSIH